MNKCKFNNVSEYIYMNTRIYFYDHSYLENLNSINE